MAVGLSAQLGRPLHVAVPVGGVTPVGQAAAVDPFLTANSTGTFTPAAVKEATRDGAPPIDLVDGGELAEKLRELGLGVRKEIVEVARVDEQWFKSV